MGHFRLEVGRRIAAFRAANGPVGFGGHLATAADDTFALPDNPWAASTRGRPCSTTRLSQSFMCMG